MLFLSQLRSQLVFRCALFFLLSSEFPVSGFAVFKFILVVVDCLGCFVWEDFSGEAATGDEAGSLLVDLKCRTKI